MKETAQRVKAIVEDLITGYDSSITPKKIYIHQKTNMSAPVEVYPDKNEIHIHKENFYDFEWPDYEHYHTERVISFNGIVTDNHGRSTYTASFLPDQVGTYIRWVGMNSSVLYRELNNLPVYSEDVYTIFRSWTKEFGKNAGNMLLKGHDDIFEIYDSSGDWKIKITNFDFNKFIAYRIDPNYERRGPGPGGAVGIDDINKTGTFSHTMKSCEWSDTAHNNEFSSPLNTSVVLYSCLLYTSPSPRDATLSRMRSSA